MRFFTSAPAILAMVTAAVAQNPTPDFNPVWSPATGDELLAGSTTEIVWEAPEKYADITVSIRLIGGADPNTLVPIADIVSGIPNSDESYMWNIDASLGSEAVYGLIFTSDSDPQLLQYSQPFQIKPSNDGGDGDDGDHETSVPVVTATGTMIVTTSLCPPTETPIATSTFAPNTTHIETHSSIWVTSTSIAVSESHYPNSTSTYSAPTLPPVEPPVSTSELPEVPPPSSTPTGVPGSAARFGSGALAVAGGLAIAMLL